MSLLQGLFFVYLLMKVSSGGVVFPCETECNPNSGLENNEELAKNCAVIRNVKEFLDSIKSVFGEEDETVGKFVDIFNRALRFGASPTAPAKCIENLGNSKSPLTSALEAINSGIEIFGRSKKAGKSVAILAKRVLVGSSLLLLGKVLGERDESCKIARLNFKNFKFSPAFSKILTRLGEINTVCGIFICPSVLLLSEIFHVDASATSLFATEGLPRIESSMSRLTENLIFKKGCKSASNEEGSASVGLKINMSARVNDQLLELALRTVVIETSNSIKPLEETIKEFEEMTKDEGLVALVTLETVETLQFHRDCATDAKTGRISSECVLSKSFAYIDKPDVTGAFSATGNLDQVSPANKLWGNLMMLEKQGIKPTIVTDSYLKILDTVLSGKEGSFNTQRFIVGASLLYSEFFLGKTVIQDNCNFAKQSFEAIWSFTHEIAEQQVNMADIYPHPVAIGSGSDNSPDYDYIYSQRDGEENGGIPMREETAALIKLDAASWKEFVESNLPEVNQAICPSLCMLLDVVRKEISKPAKERRSDGVNLFYSIIRFSATKFDDNDDKILLGRMINAQLIALAMLTSDTDPNALSFLYQVLEKIRID